MYTVALFGAGKIGVAIAALLTGSGRYQVRVCDVTLKSAEAITAQFSSCSAHQLNLKDEAGTLKLLTGCQAVISALPFFCNVEVARMAVKAGAHYLDLTEDVETTRQVSALADGAAVALMPQCGLAPGFISIAGADLTRSFARVDSVRMRVGALPIYPSNRLKYNLTWSTDGLINEYCNLGEAIINGKLQATQPLESYERISLDGVEYEAFNTSGGLGTLCETLAGKVRALDYKTMRYPGHRDLVAFLLYDMGFLTERAELKRIFERCMPGTGQDKCIVFVEVCGWSAEKLIQRTYASTIYHGMIGKHHFGAIQITTAAGICAPLDLLLTGKLPRSAGFIRCEEITLTQFLQNEFGRYYQDEAAQRDLAG